MKTELSFIDLFAGCGGLSLGLENAVPVELAERIGKHLKRIIKGG